MYRGLEKILHFAIKGQRVLIIFTLLFVIAGGALGYYFLPQAWSELRRIGGGLLGGLGAAIIVLTSRMVGAYSETEE